MKPENARSDRDTPASFVERLGNGLRAHAAGKRAAAPANAGYSELPMIAGYVDTIAAWVNAIDTSDPRLYAFMIAHGVLRDPDNRGEWVPGGEQSRVLARLGSNGKFDADHAVTELMAAALEDVAVELRNRHSLADSELQRLRAAVEQLQDIQAHIDQAKSRMGIAQSHREADVANLARMAQQTALAASIEAEQANPDETLPEGVRRRGAGFQAYGRVAGRQFQKTFANVADAVEWRDREKAAA